MYNIIGYNVILHDVIRYNVILYNVIRVGLSIGLGLEVFDESSLILAIDAE